MDKSNIEDSIKIFGNDPEKKIHLLLDFSKNSRNIADPWFTGNFNITYSDILEGCKSFISYLEKSNL